MTRHYLFLIENQKKKSTTKNFYKTDTNFKQQEKKLPQFILLTRALPIEVLTLHWDARIHDDCESDDLRPNPANSQYVNYSSCSKYWIW